MKKRLTAVLLAVLLMIPTYAVANAETVFEITRQPDNIEAPVGTTGFTTVEARAEGEITYRWYCWDAEGEEWVDTGKLDEYGNLVREWEGYDADTIYVPVTESSVGQQFFCLLTNEDGDTITSDVVTVGEGLTSEITIETQPEDIWAGNGEIGTAYVEVLVESEPIVEITYVYPEVPAVNDSEPVADIPEEHYEESGEDEVTEPTDGGEDAYGEPGEGETEYEVTPVEEVPVEPIPQEIFIERNTELTYKWLYMDADTGTWQTVDCEGHDGDTIRIPVTAANDGQQLMCLIRTADGGKAESDVITVHLVGAPAPEEPEVTDDSEPEQTAEPEPEEPNKLEQEEIPVPSEITIVTQPMDIIAAVGQTGTTAVEVASEAKLSYQWYYKTKGSTVWKPSGFTGCATDTISVPVTAARIGQQYKCVITTDDGGMIETDVVTVFEHAPAEITIMTQPSDIKVKVGQTGTAAVEATSDATLSYQWYFRRGSAAWQASGFEGCKTDTISVPVITARIGQQYKCVITSEDGCSIETDVITVMLPDPSEITIVTQPEDIHAKLGQLGTATVEASSDAALSYQWYFKAKNSSTWQASGFTGCKTDTISVPVEKQRVGQQYKCVITTDDGGKVETEAVTVLQPLPSEIIIETQPEDIQAKLGVNETAMVKAYADSGAALSYQWYFKAKNTDEWKASGFAGNKTNTISVPVATSRIGQKYKCVITTADGGKAETEAITILDPLPSEITIETQPTDMYGSIGYNATAAVVVTADTDARLSYQWYFKAKGSDEWKVSGMTGNKTAAILVPVTAARIGQQYKCVITTADGGKAETEPVTIYESIDFSITSNPDSYRSYEGDPVELAVSSSENSGISYQWYKDGKELAGATGSRLYFNAVAADDAGEYCCVVSGNGHTETSDAATVIVFK